MQLQQHSWFWAQNFDQSFAGDFQSGNKTPNLAWNVASLPSLTNQPQNTSILVAVRAALTGDPAAVAATTISLIYVSGSAITDWTAPGLGNNLSNAGANVSSGAFLLRASYLGLTIDSSPLAWSIIAHIVTGSKKKWSPGHFLGANTILSSGSTASNAYPETDNTNNLDLVLGYRAFLTWGALQQQQGVFNWTILDALVNRLATAYNKPKKLILAVLPGSFGSTNPSDTDYSTLPQYIMQGSAYGAAGHAAWNFNVTPATVVITNAGSHGWWGGNGNGNTWAACLHRPTVMAEWIALHQAIAARYDSNVTLDSIWFQENSWWIGGSSANRCPDFSASAVDTQQRALIAACAAAFRQTNIQYQNTWAADISLTQKFEAFMVQNGILPGSADTTGAVKIAASATRSLGSWGMDAYQGVIVSGSTYTGPDLRPVIPSAMDVEGPDLGAYNFGTRFTTGPTDALAALKNSYKSAYAVWCYLTANTGAPTPALWSGAGGLAQFLNNPANALTNTAYPTATGY